MGIGNNIIKWWIILYRNKIIKNIKQLKQTIKQNKYE